MLFLGTSTAALILAPVLFFLYAWNSWGVSGITIYPNPTHGSFVVDMIFDKEQAEVMVSVTNILGEVILKHKLNDIKKELYQIDLSKYGAGVYFIKIAPTDEELAVRKKVVVIK